MDNFQAAFVPAVVRDEAAADDPMFLHLSSGMELLLPQAIPAQRLAELVHALETRAEA